MVQLLLHLSFTQKKLGDAASRFLKSKTGLAVNIDQIQIALPNSISIKNIYSPDGKNDTLLDAGRITVVINALELLKKTISIQKIEIDEAQANLIKYSKDSTLNLSPYLQLSKNSETRPDKHTDTSKQQPFIIDIKQVRLNSVTFTHKDNTTGNKMFFRSGFLNIEMERTDIAKQIFHVRNITINNSKGVIRQTTQSSDEQNDLFPPIDIKLDNTIEIRNSDFIIKNARTGSKNSFNDINLSLSTKKFDLNDKNIHLDQIKLSNTSIKLHQYKYQKDSNPIDNPEILSIPWNIKAEEIRLQNTNLDIIQPDSLNEYQRMKYSNLNAKISESEINNETIKTKIKSFSVIKDKAIEIVDLQFMLKIESKKAELNDLRLKIDGSDIAQSTTIHYKSIPDFIKEPFAAEFEILIEPSTIVLGDLKKVLPEIDTLQWLKDKNDQKIRFNAQIAGKNNNLSIQEFSINTDSTAINLNGEVKNFLKPDLENIQLEIKEFKTTRTDINNLIPQKMFPHSITLPKKIAVKGVYKGSNKRLKTHFALNTSMGNIETSAKLKNDTLDQNRWLKATINTKNFKINKLLNNDTLGPITLSTHLNAQITSDSLIPEANLKSNIKRVELLGYNYENLKLEISKRKKQLKAALNYQDSNLIADLNAMAVIDTQNPSYDLNLELPAVDLQALNISRKPLKFRANITGNAEGTSINNASGKIKISDIYILYAGKKVKLDSVNAKLNNNKGLTRFTLNSDPLIANYKGTIQPTAVPEIVKNHIASFYKLYEDSAAGIVDTGYFDFNIKISDSPFLTNILMPGLALPIPITINSNYDAHKQSFSFEGALPKVRYNDIQVDSLQIISANKDLDSLGIQIRFNKISQKNIFIHKTHLNASARNDSLTINLAMLDEKNSNKYKIKSVVTQTGDSTNISFSNKKLILDHNQFNIPETNKIVKTAQGYYFSDMILQSEKQKFSFQNDSSAKKSYKVLFQNFPISNIAGIISKNKPLANGLLNGSATLNTNPNKLFFNADFNIQHFTILSDTVFSTININAYNNKEKTIEINSDFKGENNLLSLNGTVVKELQKSKINFQLNIDELSLQSFKPLLKDQIVNTDGTISGKFDINGTLSMPQISGALQLNNFSIKPTYLNSTLYFKNEEIKIEQNSIAFNSVETTDKNNNTTTLDGTINFENFATPTFDLSIDAQDFQFLNTEYKQGKLYYGKVVADINGDFTGTPNRPIINVSTKLKEESEFHFIIPATNTATIEQEGLIEFKQQKDTTWNNMFSSKIKTAEENSKNKSQSIHLNANIDISPKMDIYIEIDPTSEEQLYLKGDANLSLNLRSGQVPSLAGKFEIQKGVYSLTLYKFIKRQFQIKPGSYLIWNGDIQNARADITATYKVRTSPLPLITDQTEGLSAENVNKYNRIKPFMVNLHISKQLLKPGLDFELKLPPEETDALIEAKLDQLNRNESQLNKQIFSLLLFNSFIETSATASSSTAYELNSTARTSVSKLLTKQINRFSEKYIKQVDVDVGVNSYYQSAGRAESGKTEVTLDVSKQLLNDKLSVKVGGNFNVEGNEQTQNQNYKTVTGDVVIEYKIDEDGKYRIQGFSKREYEDFFTGEINKTGAAFIFNKDFYDLMQLLNLGKQNNEKDTLKNTKNKDQ